MINKLPNQAPQEQLSFDLGWLLQNEQLSDERLCGMLLDEISPQIEHLAAYFLRMPADRAAAADGVVLRVLQRRRSYKSNISGKAWLYRLIFAECLARVPQYLWSPRQGVEQVLRAGALQFGPEAHFGPYLHELSDRQRLFALLFYGHDLSPADIAAALTVDLPSVQADLAQAQEQLLAHRRGCESCSNRHSTLAGVEKALRADFQANAAPLETAQRDRAEWSASLLRRLAGERAERRRRTWVVGLAGVALALLMVVNALASLRLGTLAAPPSTETPRLIFVPERRGGVLPNHQDDKLLPGSSDGELAGGPVLPAVDPGAGSAIADNQPGWQPWHTLWADVQINTYNAGWVSNGTGFQPGTSVRKQIWLGPPGTARVISGPARGGPDLTYAVSGGHIFGQNFDSGRPIDRTGADLIPDADLLSLFSSRDHFTPGGQFIFVDIDTVAGNPVLVMDWSDGQRVVYRYWIDYMYGIVLRRTEYSRVAFPPVSVDITVTKIVFDADFPDAIFEPQRYKGDHFAQDYSGAPELQDLRSALQTRTAPARRAAIPRVTPTAKPYVLAAAYLTFQEVPTAEIQSSDSPRLELFADQTYLGKLPLAGKTVLACQRSPDGSQIAYNSPPQAGAGDTGLLVADLAALPSARPALPDGITSGDFAFSPDNRRLAFFGCQKADGFCGIFILDLTSGALKRLAALSFADYITWSPDGQQIALVGHFEVSQADLNFSASSQAKSEMMNMMPAWHFQVIEAASGRVTYSARFDWFHLSPPADSPTNRWAQPFKLPTVGYAGCTSPPG